MSDLRTYPRYESGRWAPNVCEKCGSVLDRERRDTGRFSAYSGAPKKQERRVCPNRRGWLEGHYRSGWAEMTYIPPPPPPLPQAKGKPRERAA